MKRAAYEIVGGVCLILGCSPAVWLAACVLRFWAISVADGDPPAIFFFVISCMAALIGTGIALSNKSEEP